MRRKVPCTVCGRLSRNLLFKSETLDIPICSRKCEHEYLKNLSPGGAEHSDVVRYLDHRITQYRKRNRIGWGFCGVGVVLLLLGFLIPDVGAFITGNIIVAVGTLATRHYEDTIKKTVIQRKRLAI